MSFVHVYQGAITVKEKDGTLVSEDQSAPIKITLDASKKETSAIKLAIRTDTGYETYGSVLIKPYGGTYNRFKIARDDNYNSPANALNDAYWQDSLVITDTIKDENYIFWISATTEKDEVPQKDISTSIEYSGTVHAI